MRYAAKFLAAIAVVCALVAPCGAEEKITSYSSAITVNKDATLTVTETIKVIAENTKIKHGIYRDFPTRYENRRGERYVVELKLLSVSVDGAPEQYRAASITNGQRIYIGDPNKLVSAGTHTYVINYSVNRELGFFADHDELYWNVNGNGWDFAIDKASAVVTLPPGIPHDSIKVEGYTGPKGSKAKNLKAWVKPSGQPAFVTTRPLGPKEGLTIVATWPKGHVTPPTGEMRVRWFLSDNAGALVGLLGLLVVLGYFSWAQSRVGVDPHRGAVVPQWDPPEGLSPAAVRYISHMGYDNKAITAALIDAAVKGCLGIKKEGRTYTLQRKDGDTSRLTSEEHVAVKGMLGSGSSAELDNSNASVFQAAIKQFKKAIDSQFGKTFFARHTGHAAVGAVLSVLTLVGAFALSARGDMLFMVAFLTLWTAAVGFILANVISRWRAGARATAVFSAGCTTLFALPFVGAWFLIAWVVAQGTSPALIAIVCLLPIANVVFFRLLRAYTAKGRAIMDRIDGLKMYMQAAEKERLDAMNPPDRTPELFEKLLPYAIALGVEQRWSEQFADVLAKAQADGYSPDWYNGAAFTSGGIAGFASSVGSSFSGAISSASTPPGSSSGGGGGGSSGGGGGGGGGGGW